MSNWLNKIRSNSKGIIYILFVYIIAQFLWWEILMVRQNNALLEEKQKVLELTISDTERLQAEIDKLQESKIQKTYMVVGEGTIFLLLLLYGINLIRKANRKEHELLDQKNNFLLSITHELKTPLATTKLQLQTLKKHQLAHEKQQELIEIAINENERLNSLIDNVLLATRMQENEYHMAKERVDLSDLITKIATASYRSSLESGNLKLIIEPSVLCEIDKLAFPSILTNLVDNAFKYSGELMNVEIKLKKKSSGIVLEVSDRGMGIKDSEKNRIFDQFYRSGSEETRKTKGTGLGLFIVKYLIEKHGGTIAVKDNSPNGSVFEIHLN
ncbi:MAG: GHKL domain-containing protein [Sphingobacteriaceae bacterium]|nr:GHKL domain-containing protein [Sphingobacteriaceae bacterium]